MIDRQLQEVQRKLREGEQDNGENIAKFVALRWKLDMRNGDRIERHASIPYVLTRQSGYSKYTPTLYIVPTHVNYEFYELRDVTLRVQRVDKALTYVERELLSNPYAYLICVAYYSSGHVVWLHLDEYQRLHNINMREINGYQNYAYPRRAFKIVQPSLPDLIRKPHVVSGTIYGSPTA